MRIGLCVVAISAGLAPVAAYSDPIPPFEIKGVRFGDSPETAKESFIFLQCLKRPRKPSDTIEITVLCGAKNNTYAGVSASLVLVFDDKGFGEAHVTVSPDDFSVVADAIKSKYGPPVNVTRYPMVTAMNARFENISVKWKYSDATIVAVKYANRIDQALVSITSDRFSAARKAAKQNAKAAAQEDM